LNPEDHVRFPRRVKSMTIQFVLAVSVN